MKKIIFSMSLLFIFCTFSKAEEFNEVPKSIFGITLGEVYHIGGEEGFDTGNIPIKKFAGAKKFLGQGVHFYFQPDKEYKEFDYVELNKNPDDDYFETSFRLYLLPVIPSRIKTIEQLENLNIKWEVTTIEWSKKSKSKKEGYFWAIEFCKIFGADLSIEPEVLDFYEEGWYECEFCSGDRKLTVSSNAQRMSVALSFSNDLFEYKDNNVESKIFQLRANDIRPYK